MFPLLEYLPPPNCKNPLDQLTGTLSLYKQGSLTKVNIFCEWVKNEVIAMTELVRLKVNNDESIILTIYKLYIL